MKIGMQNFQGVTDYQEIEIAPITLVYGQNSSGKSTIYDALVVIGDLFEKEFCALPEKWVNRSSKQGRSISRGSETILRVSGVPNDRYWSEDEVLEWLKVRPRGRDEDDGFLSRLMEILEWGEGNVGKELSCEYRWGLSGGCVNFSGYRVEVDGALALDWSNGFSDDDSVVRINLRNKFVEHCLGGISEPKILQGLFRIEDGVAYANVRLDEIRPGVNDLSCAISEWAYGGHVDDPFFVLMEFLVSGATYHVSVCGRFSLLSALRPERAVECRSRKGSFDFGFDGCSSYAWKLIAAELFCRSLGRDDYVGNVDVINEWLSGRERLDSGFCLDVDAEFIAPISSVGEIIGAGLKCAYSYIFDNYEMCYRVVLKDLRGGRVVEVEEVGVGVSQVVPVLASAAIWERVYIQQPELHLHPRMQAALADVFIEKKNNNGGFVLETHSELLVLRVLRRIRETYDGSLAEEKLALRADQVSVIYVERDSDGETFFRRLRISRNGEFMDRWPNGFFAERDAEIF